MRERYRERSVDQAEIKLVGSLPESWKDKALNSYDKEWVASKLLNKLCLTTIGNLYVMVEMWTQKLKESYPDITERLQANVYSLVRFRS